MMEKNWKTNLKRSLSGRAARRGGRRFLSGLLCAAMLCGAAPFLAPRALAAEEDEGEEIRSPGFPAASAFDNKDLPTCYLYYWRDAANGGIPTSPDKTEKIPVLITWNDKYYLRADGAFTANLREASPQCYGNNAAHVPIIGVDTVRNTANMGSPKESYSRLYGHRFESKLGSAHMYIGDLEGKVGGEYYDMGESVKWHGSWNSDAEHGWKLGHIGAYYHSRHYPMGSDALLGNLPIYSDLKEKGYAVSATLPGGTPFLLDMGKSEKDPNGWEYYALGYDLPGEQTVSHFLVGSYYMRSQVGNVGSNWFNIGDWFLNDRTYTREQFSGNNLDIEYIPSDAPGGYINNAGNGIHNTEMEKRTWTFGMTPSGEFTIGTYGATTLHRVDGNWVTEEGGDATEDRLVAMLAYNYEKVHEGWLYHSLDGANFNNWLRYWGGDESDYSHASLSDKPQSLFKIYVGDPYICSKFQKDVTVQRGQTMNIDGPCLLDEGQRITVEDGAVLCISGWFINKGVIEVRPGGKLIVQHLENKQDYQEGLLNTFDTKKGSNAGGLLCDGTLIVMSDANVIAAGNYGIQFGASAQAINYGTIAAENFSVYRDHTIENRGEYSRVFCGWGVDSTGYGLSRTKNDGSDSYIGKARIESASEVKLAKDAVYGPRAKALYINQESGVRVTTDMDNRSGYVGSGKAAAAAASAPADRLAAIVAFDPAEWEKKYFTVPKKVRV